MRQVEGSRKADHSEEGRNKQTADYGREKDGEGKLQVNKHMKLKVHRAGNKRKRPKA